MTTTASAAAAAPSLQKKQTRDTQAMAGLQCPDKAMVQGLPGFNEGACSNGTVHLKELHACTYCLGLVKRLHVH